VVPEIVAHVIALASDAASEIAAVRKLPLDVQVLALEQIGKLTAKKYGGARNVVGTVVRLAIVPRPTSVGIRR